MKKAILSAVRVIGLAVLLAATVWSADGPPPPAGVNEADARLAQQAMRELAEARAGLSSLLEQRSASDTAKGPSEDVILDLPEALTSYANFLAHPMPGTAPQWRDTVGMSLSRIGGMRQEFAPNREDVEMTFQRRGGAWLGPRLGMLSSKFREAYHLHSCASAELKATDAGVSGGFELTSVWGVARFDMHFSGEGTDFTIPEFSQWKDSGGRFWPDWWIGPRERLRPWKQRFTLNSGQRRGWLLKATLVAPADLPITSSSRDLDLHLWVEDGRILRGYALVPDKLPGRGPETVLAVNAWSVKDKALDAELVLGAGAGKRVCQLHAALASPDAGGLTGTYRTVRERENREKKGEMVKEEKSGALEGALYRAFAGTYTTEGPDGRWTGELAAGVAPALQPEKKEWPAPSVKADATPAEQFANVVELYKQVTALDWALREYPLPVEQALRRTRLGLDDRYTYWPVSQLFFRKATKRDPVPLAPLSLHEAVAASLAGGPAQYLKDLVRTAQAALADRRAGGTTVVGIPDPVDPDFGPFGAVRRMEAGNALSEPANARSAEWRVVGGWSCFGFIQRTSSFETAPYLPEIGAGPLPDGFGVKRIPSADPCEHNWCWRAEPDAVDGQVTIPRDCLMPSKAIGPRERWGGANCTGVSGETLDFYYHHMATWYATATIRSERARQVWIAAKIAWDGRVWLNDCLVWRPAREHTPERIAVFSVNLPAGESRLTVCCSRRPVEDGNNGNFGTHVFKYGERSFGSFVVWLGNGGEPRSAEAVAAALEKERASDKASAAAVAAGGIRGHRGDGSGRYPDAKPPLAWDFQKGINIRWKKALPTQDAEPVVVGPRLFIPTHTSELVCLDALTGADLWRKKPEVQGAPPAGAYPPDAVTASYTMSSLLWRPPQKPPTVKPYAGLNRSCLTCLADGRRVWMHDPRGVVACFDHEGKQVWAQAVAPQVPRFTEGGYAATRVLPLTPPSIVGSRLLAAAGEGLSAFDTEKGTPLWQRPKLDYLGQFAVMDLGDGNHGQLVLLNSGEVLDAATGETLIARCAPLVPDSGCQPVVEGRLAYFHAGSSAIRFWREGDQVRSRVLWDSPRDMRRRQSDLNHGNDVGGVGTLFQGAFPPAPVVWDGLLLGHAAEPNSISHGPQNSMRVLVYDAATGCSVSQRYCTQINAMRPVSSTILAGGYLFCADKGGNHYGNYPGFPMTPALAVVTAEEQPRRVISDQPWLGSACAPVFAGRRMYLAGEDQVICVARPDELGDKFSAYELAALKVGFFDREIGAEPGISKEFAVAAPAGLTIGKGVPLVTLESARTPSRWLFGGPFAVEPQTDVFAASGGAGAVKPEEGQKVAYTTLQGQPGEVTFVPLDKKHLIDRDYAGRLGNLKLNGGVSFASASGRNYNTTCYLYSVLEVLEPGSYRVEFGKARIRDLAVYLAGQPLEPGCVVALAPGRYPLMVRAAIAVCGGWEPLEWYMQFRAVPAGKRPVPQPLAGPLPAGARTPVAPLWIGGGLPPTLLGAWPLGDQAADDPYAVVQPQSNGIIGEGAAVTLGGLKTAFRPVPPEALVRGGQFVDQHTFNVPLSAAGFGAGAPTCALSPQALFGGERPVRGLFFTVLDNRRAVMVELSCSKGVRCWLSGREVRDAEAVRLVPGLYPFLMDCRVTAETGNTPLALTFREVADPAIEKERWFARVRRNAEMLKSIAASGPEGAYAQAALEALARAAQPGR